MVKMILAAQFDPRPHTMSPFESVFFLGKILPNFDLKNRISAYTKDFSWKKLPKFASFRKKQKKT